MFNLNLQKHNQNTVLIVGLLIIVLVLLYKNSQTTETIETTEGFEIGTPRYGLRGDLLKTSHIKHKYIHPTSYYRIDNSPGPMYESRFEPSCTKKGDECKIVDCPSYYDNPDKVCYSCEGENYINPNQPKLCGTNLIYSQIYDSNHTTPKVSYNEILE